MKITDIIRGRRKIIYSDYDLWDYMLPIEKEIEQIKNNLGVDMPCLNNLIFVFPIALADNEIDTDFTRFTEESLTQLAKLFLGKAGIFNKPSITARIYSTQVIHTHYPLIDSDFNPICFDSTFSFILAKAFMIRTKENESIIKEIETGIKKEVSISCSVSKRLCPICGNAMKSDSCCGYSLGDYTENLTIFCPQLINPIEAYEWSFVSPASITENTKSDDDLDVIKHKNNSPTVEQRLDIMQQEINSIKEQINQLKLF
jgi:hypothetical protein